MDSEHVKQLVTMMESDHRRQGALLNRIGQTLDEGYVDQVRLALSEFALRLHKHIKIENSLLAPALGLPADGDGLTSLPDLQAEHAEIMAKLALLEGRLDERAERARVCDAWQDFTVAFTRHEQEEERHLFPFWQRALVDLSDDASVTLFRRVREIHQASP
jgi:hemerythrin-like domain-containing protein